MKFAGANFCKCKQCNFSKIFKCEKSCEDCRDCVMYCSFYFNLNFLSSIILTDSKLYKKISTATNLKPTIMCYEK